MTLKQSLGRAREALADHNIEYAPLESELLLRHALELSRVQLYLDLDRELSPEQEESFSQLVNRRLSGEPTAYITGHREFYGLDFCVDSRVLIPRPESELLVEKTVDLAEDYSLATIADIGTGCGAIAICLALMLPKTRIYATDVSDDALKVASLNCQKHGVASRIRLRRGDMLAPLPEAVDLIVANLPYVKESELLTLKSSEPLLALNGGTDGLEGIRWLCGQAGYKLRPGGHLLLEIGQGQGPAVTSIWRSHFPGSRIEITPDLGGIERVLMLTA